MPSPDEQRRRRLRADPEAAAAAPSAAPPPPSKTQQKREMHALQDLGERMVELEPARFAALAREAELPERLVDAIALARAITARGARKRQLQYVGKLMRDQDPAPIVRRLELWAHGHEIDAARQHALERWRERLLAEPDAQEAFAASHPGVDRARLRTLVARAQDERGRGGPPHAFREIFRLLKSLDADAE